MAIIKSELNRNDETTGLSLIADDDHIRNANTISVNDNEQHSNQMLCDDSLFQNHLQPSFNHFQFNNNLIDHQQSFITKTMDNNDNIKNMNSEKRKEKSRKAARERRSQEAKIFDEIEQILPVSSKILDNLDKASLVRIAINYLKIRSVVDPFQVPNIVDSFDLADASILNTLNGFMFVMSKDGDIIYLSDNVERFLGLTHIDLMGQSIYDYSHPCDHDDIKSFLEPLNNAFNASKAPTSASSTTLPTPSSSTTSTSTTAAIIAGSQTTTKTSTLKTNISNNQNSSANNAHRTLQTNNNGNNNANINNNGQAIVVEQQPNSDSKQNDIGTNKRQSDLLSPSKRRLIEAIGEAVGPYFIRMKCTLTNKGRNLNLKSANYKVIKCRGRMIDLEVASPMHSQMIGENFHHYMIAIAEVIQHPIRIEIPLKSDVFVSKHTPDMKFAYVDESVKELFGYNVNDLIGTSFYQYFDANDFTQLSILFKTLFAKGQCDFGQYKFLAKTGGYRWITTQATIINEPNSSQPQSIILIHQVISNIQDGYLLTSDVQTAKTATVTYGSTGTAVETPPIITTTPLLNHSAVSTTSSIIKTKPRSQSRKQPLLDSNIKTNCQVPELSNIIVPNANSISQTQTPLLKTFKIKEESENDEELLVVQQQLCQRQSNTDQFISSTETVLAPKTADMESGFLVFTEDNKGVTVLSDADDLTHLAPDAGDLCVPMLPDMDFADMNLFDEIFLNSSSYNIATSVLSEDEFLNNLASLDGDKLKLDGLDNFNLEFDNGLKKFPNENLLGMNNKDLKSNGFDQQYPLDMNSNDPFLSFTNTNNDEFLISNSPTTRSDCSINESFTSNSPINSSSSSSLQYSPKSISCDESSKLCDSDEKDLEMRAPFIPIDDDYLLNDFTYSNLDDLFDWISNNDGGNIGNNSNNKPNAGSPYQHDKIQQKKSSIPKLTGGCLEALLQNDELICNLKNKMYSSNQILNKDQLLLDNNGSNRETIPTVAIVQQQQQQQHNSNHQQNNQNQNGNNNNTNIAFSAFIADNKSNSMKRKNSNIFVYTTMSNTGEKKIKNLILTPEIPANKLNGTANNQTTAASIHHFVLTKNNELIPKVTFVNQQQQQQSTPPQLVSGIVSAVANIQQTNIHHLNQNNGNNESTTSATIIKENVFKKPRSDSSIIKNFSSNSVLLNLLVNGSDLTNGYELTHHPSPFTNNNPHHVHHQNPTSHHPHQNHHHPSNNHHNSQQLQQKATTENVTNNQNINSNINNILNAVSVNNCQQQQRTSTMIENNL